MISEAAKKQCEIEETIAGLSKSNARQVLHELVAKTIEMKAHIRSMKLIALNHDVDTDFVLFAEQDASKVAASVRDLQETFDRFAKKFEEDCYERILAKAKAKSGG